MFLHFIGSTEIAFILAKWILPSLLTDFQTPKDRQFSLCHFSYIHNLQNKMYSFRINNEIPNYKICLCAQLRSIWVRIRVLVGFIQFILSNFVFTFLFLCCDVLLKSLISGWIRYSVIFSDHLPHRASDINSLLVRTILY
jgi:hypothetical protein